MEAIRSRILVVSLLLFIAGSALAWNQVYRTATIKSSGETGGDAEMVIESGGRLVAWAPPAKRPSRQKTAKKPDPPLPHPKPRLRTITVRSGDSLFRVAQRELGRGSRWKEIAQLNEIAPPYRIHPGQTLDVPPR